MRNLEILCEKSPKPEDFRHQSLCMLYNGGTKSHWSSSFYYNHDLWKTCMMSCFQDPQGDTNTRAVPPIVQTRLHLTVRPMNQGIKKQAIPLRYEHLR